MSHCPHCAVEVSERAIFCSECGKTVRCRECKDVLDANAKFCVSCGASVNSDNGAVTNDPTQAGAPKYNIIEYREDTRSRHFKAQVTDHAVDAMGGHLSLLMSRTVGSRPQRSERHPLDGPQSHPADLFDSIGDGEPAVNAVSDATAENQGQLPRAAIAPSGDAEAMKLIFQRNSEDKLILINPRLKQKNQRDYVSRLSVLFTYANEIEGRESVSRSEVTAQLSAAKILDSNAHRWLKTTDLLVIDGDQLRLSVPGHDYAKSVLKEIYDPNVETKWSLGSKPVTRSKRGSDTASSKAAEAGENGNSGRRAPRGTGVDSQVQELADEQFFSTDQPVAAVQVELESRGYKFEKWRITQALVRLTQKKLLKRNQNAQGELTFKARK
jgi:double zinc ribbon protein